MKKYLQILFIMILIAVPVLADDPDALTVTSAGDVGINTPAPRAKLDVNGRIMDQAGFVMPVGAILPYGGTTAPTGWLLCDGTAYARTGAYADLFAAIGTAFGAPDAGNFNVPDLRGQFLRGVNSGSGIDPNATSRTALKPGGNTADNVGSTQDDQLKSHNHSGTINANVPPDEGTGSNVQVGGKSGTKSVTIENSGGSETRPKNVYVNFIIKY